ncbi:MAG: phenylglyoxylate dehydrogenase [Lachnospiraceae bacterium]|nr:phenylglyoxylate dehydrogenase [Lachnospiraceae bacterium]
MSEVKVINGNMAAAMGACLCRPDIIAAYPITPQTPIVEYLADFVTGGRLGSSVSEVESELSAMSVCTGASLAGSRVFTATASQGLALMYEPYFRASTLRLPIVMAVANREMISPQTLWGGPQDSLTVRDAGWLQIYVEDNQEILDTLIMAYRIAEDKKVLLPINVCFDGFYLSHMSERVEIPDQESVDAFLPAYAPEHIILDPRRPMAVDPLTNGYLLTEYRLKHMMAQQNALKLLEAVDEEFGERFGRSYGGAVEEYRCEDADYVMVTMGSMTGVAKDCVDEARRAGKKVGLLKIRMVRPFPAERVARVLMGRKAFGVIDRNVSFGWNTGIIYEEVCASMNRAAAFVPNIPFIAGLGGEDITAEHIRYAIDEVMNHAEDSVKQDTVWLNREDKGR